MDFVTCARSEGYELTPEKEITDSFIKEQLSSFRQRMAGSISAGSFNGLPMRLELYLWDTDDFNAFACNYDDVDIIVVSKQVFVSLSIISRALVSQLPKFERALEGHVEYRSTHHKPGSVEANRDLAKGAFESDALEAVASDIYTIAVTFILCHEYYHIYNGHTSVSDGSLTSLFWSEGTQREYTADEYKSEALEYDADQCAIQSCIRLCMRPDIKVVDGIEAWNFPVNGPFGTVQQSWSIVMTSILMVGAILALGGSSDCADPEPSSHPHASFRITYMVNFGWQVTRFRTGKQVIDEGSMQAISVMFLNLWRSVFPSGSSVDGFDEMVRPDFIEFHNQRMGKWRGAWEILHSTLDQKKRGGRIAPPQPVEKNPAL